MTARSVGRAWVAVVAVVAVGAAGAAGALTGCGSATAVESSTTGDLSVRVSATGEAVDTTYDVWRDDAYSYSITTSDTLGLTLDSGTYNLDLRGLADNCAVEGDNPRDATVAVGETTEVLFRVGCTANGHVSVTLITTGTDIDDMFTLAFNGDYKQVLVGPHQTVTVSLPVGTYSVALTGVADNCAVQGDSSLQVEATADATATASFWVVCTG